MAAVGNAGHLATSVDGRHFVLAVPVDALDVRVGSYVVIEDGDSTRLGYATTVALDPSDGRRAAIRRPCLREAFRAVS